MLGAMMVRASAYANAVNFLTAAPWTVPSGVTKIYINAATKGAGPYFTDTAGNYYVGAGGGGAAIFDAPITVTPGDVLVLSTAPETGSDGTTYSMLRSSIRLFYIQEGQRGNQAGNNLTGHGGYGGEVRWDITSQVATRGAYGTTTAAGGDGAIVALTGGGLIKSGGGGGGGGSSVIPLTDGTAGGSVGDYAGYANAGGFGGGGGGFQPGFGQTLLVASGGPAYLPANGGTTSIIINY